MGVSGQRHVGFLLAVRLNKFMGISEPQLPHLTWVDEEHAVLTCTGLEHEVEKWI